MDLNKCPKCNSMNALACLKCLTPLKFLMVEQFIRKELARNAGRATSEKKAKASRLNGKKGGRKKNECAKV